MTRCLMKTIKITCKPRLGVKGLFTPAFVSLAWLAAGVSGWAQTPTISPAALEAHATITEYTGPATCIACHESQARAMFGSVHYQEMGETPAVPNIAGPAGKGRNGARVMNSYCGTPSTSSRATCATCHVGNGRVPAPELTAEQLHNIDCLMCHQDAYKRVPAPPYQPLTFPGTNGTLHTIQMVVEDETGFQFVPDTGKMTISILEAARLVHLPTRASCLRCHAGAGGSDGGKRGDLSTVTVNPPVSSDVHMSPQGADLSCARCHSAGNHRVLGRGVDLRASDSAELLTCAKCHTDRPHGDYSARNGTARDVHALRVACQSCHIPTFAKDKSTEMERNWSHAEFSMAACRGQGGWLPSEVRASNVVPAYKWFDGTSLANELDQAPIQNGLGEAILALPNGSVQSPGAKLYPMKVHRSNAARHDASGLLVPHSTFTYFSSGDFAKSIQRGQELSGLNGPTTIVPVLEYQTINHGVVAASSALQCGACHAAYTAGGPVRMNLKTDLGYELKAPTSQLCTQCHGSKSAGFASVHDKHVRDKGYDCSNCHNFSRPERGLTRVAAIRPAAPAGPAARRLAADQIQVVWGDNSSSEQGFRVERSLDGVNFSEIAAVGPGVSSLVDSNLDAATAYYYRVQAFNAAGSSAYSMLGSATTPYPQLRLNPSAGNLVLSWPAGAADFKLQAADELSPAPGWTDVQGSVTTNNHELRITLPVTAGAKFYRLWRP